MVEAVTGTMETIRISAVEEDGIEFFQNHLSSLIFDGRSLY